jgi:hypothetical protein
MRRYERKIEKTERIGEWGANTKFEELYGKVGRFLLPDTNINVFNLESLIAESLEEPKQIDAEVSGSTRKLAEPGGNGHGGKNGNGTAG